MQSNVHRSRFSFGLQLGLLLVGLGCILVPTGAAQDSATVESTAVTHDSARPSLRPYPTSALIVSQPLSSEKRSVLEQLFTKEISAVALKNRSLKLCPPNITRVPAVDDTTTKGLAETTTSAAVEVLFRRTGERSGLELDHFGVIVEFSRSRILLRHLAPRFPSDSAGFSVPMVEGTLRPVRLEGKLGADILALVPPLRECTVQGVVLCPRRYTKGDELRVAPYVVEAIRPLVTMKADGVYAPPSGSVGKVMASLLASPGIALPNPWFRATQGSGTISQAIEFTTPREPDRAIQPSLPTSTLPMHCAVESRVDLGREEGSVRTVTKRIGVEVNSFTLSQLLDIEVGTSDLTVEGGACYLVSEWSEEVM